MEDRGEKIITLAREMLRSDMDFEPQAETATAPTRPNVSFKMLCLATMLTAVGSSAVTSIVTDTRRPINRYEKVELNALVFYVARLKGVNEDTVRAEVQDKLGIGSFDDLTELEFGAARSMLQRRAQ
jgi:hypothetical protein